MKIKRITCVVAIQSKGHKFTLSSPEHYITYSSEFQGYIVDGNVLIPSAQVREALLEEEAVAVLAVLPDLDSEPKVLKKVRK